jgi:molybdopterin synthase catalytic subunit
MPLSRLAVVRDAPSLDAITAVVEAQGRDVHEGCGAVCTFVGVARRTHKGRQVRYLEYEAYEPMALRAFARIEQEIGSEWPRAVVAIHHRVGRVAIGEASVAIAVAAAHRAEAFEACRYAIERIKQIAPVWKHEFFDQGDDWVDGATVDPDDEAARREARARACA